MMDFNGFNEATLLFAEYAAVTVGIYEEYRKDVDNFLNFIRDKIASLVQPKSIQEKQTPGYRYWWIAPNDKNKDSYPQLWFDTRSTEIVKPGILRLTACAPNAAGDFQQQLTHVTEDPSISNYCKPARGGTWSLFEVIVNYKDKNYETNAAKPIATILLEMYEVYNKFKE